MWRKAGPLGVSSAALEAAVMVDILFWVSAPPRPCGDVVVFREVQSPASVRPATLDWGTPRNL
jgi:hypothetical protein